MIDDRRRPARRIRSPAVDRPDHPRFATSCSSSATSSSCRAATTSRSRGSARSPPGASTRRSALVLVTDEGTWWPLACFWISLALAVIAAGQYVRQGAAHRPPDRRSPVRRSGRRRQGERPPGRNRHRTLQSLNLRLTPSLRCIFKHRAPDRKGTVRAPVETLPDLLSLSDDELSSLIARSRRRGGDLASVVVSSTAGSTSSGPSARRAPQGAGRDGSFEASRRHHSSARSTRAPATSRRTHELTPLPDLAELADDALRAMIRAARAARRTTSR